MRCKIIEEIYKKNRWWMLMQRGPEHQGHVNVEESLSGVTCH